MQINIGILSAAKIAERMVLPALAELSESFTIGGIASRDAQRAKMLAEKYTCNYFDNYQALLDSNDINAVYIPLPNSMHLEWVIKALQANKHVLVEKSMGCNLSEVEQMNALAQEKNLTLIENFQFRFHKQTQLIKKLLSENTIGDIRLMRCNFGFPPFSDADNIRYQAALGGGALLDAGAYPIKATAEFLGNTYEVHASDFHWDSDKEVDTWGSLYFRSNDSAAVVEAAYGFDNFYQCQIEFWGSKGKITSNRIFTSPPGQKAEIILETAQGKNIIETEADNHFKNMLNYFATCCKNENNELKKYEYAQNIHQANQIEKSKQIAHVK